MPVLSRQAGEQALAELLSSWRGLALAPFLDRPAQDQGQGEQTTGKGTPQAQLPDGGQKRVEFRGGKRHHGLEPDADCEPERAAVGQILPPDAREVGEEFDIRRKSEDETGKEGPFGDRAIRRSFASESGAREQPQAIAEPDVEASGEGGMDAPRLVAVEAGRESRPHAAIRPILHEAQGEAAERPGGMAGEPQIGPAGGGGKCTSAGDERPLETQPELDLGGEVGSGRELQASGESRLAQTMVEADGDHAVVPTPAVAVAEADVQHCPGIPSPGELEPDIAPGSAGATAQLALRCRQGQGEGVFRGELGEPGPRHFRLLAARTRHPFEKGPRQVDPSGGEEAVALGEQNAGIVRGEGAGTGEHPLRSAAVADGEGEPRKEQENLGRALSFERREEGEGLPRPSLRRQRPGERQPDVAIIRGECEGGAQHPLRRSVFAPKEEELALEKREVGIARRELASAAHRREGLLELPGIAERPDLRHRRQLVRGADPPHDSHEEQEKGPQPQGSRHHRSAGSEEVGTAQGAVDPQRELLGNERFHEIILGPEGQPPDHVALVAPRAQHDHRELRGARLAPQPSQYLEAIEPGQDTVQHHKVAGLAHRPLEAAFPIGDSDHLVPVQAEGEGEEFGQEIVVVDHQNPRHGQCSVQAADRTLPALMRRRANHVLVNFRLSRPALALRRRTANAGGADGTGEETMATVLARPVLAYRGCAIDGGWVDPGRRLEVICPSDGSLIGEIARGSEREIDLAVAAARRAFAIGPWGRMPAFERGRMLLRFAEAIRAHAEELAGLESCDTGKPIAQGRADIDACARYFEFYGGAADKLHGDTLPFLAGYTALSLREPHGVTAHIIPWNYPAQIFGRSVGAALAAGNACVVKPAEDASLSILRLAELAFEIGLPGGALNVVPGLGEEAGAALAAHPDIDFLSFTGSREVGTLVQAAAARNHVGCTLELGGKSPQILFADADLEAAMPVVVRAIVQNAGQTCSAGSRLLVERPLWERVCNELRQRFAALRVGPHDSGADVGALINRSQFERVRGFVERAKADGIPVIAQTPLPADLPAGGHYVAPVAFGPVPEDHELATEEVFGPVLACLPFEGEAEAVRIANGTPYGLVAGVWTRDGSRALRLARRIRAGQVFINAYGAGGGIELPFGGYRHSGHGREKGFEGLLEFTRIKTVVIQHGEIGERQP